MDADREHLDLAQRRDKALLKALRAECTLRRQRLIEDLRDARLAGDLTRYRRLIEVWRRFQRVYGEGEPPV